MAKVHLVIPERRPPRPPGTGPHFPEVHVPPGPEPPEPSEPPQPPRRDPVIVLDGASKDYRLGSSTVHALRDVSLQVGQGEFVVLLGPSGCGKTTLLNLVGGLEHPTRGHVWVAGRDLGHLDAKGLTSYRRRSVGFVFQFFNLIPTLTAKENVQVSARLSRDPLKAEDVLGQVGLGGRIDHFPSELSGGEQQRVAIARALVRRPPVLLCDEPTGELDAETGRHVLETLQRFNRSLGVTILVVTHNSAIAAMAHRVVTMKGGTVDHVAVNARPADASTLRW